MTSMHDHRAPAFTAPANACDSHFHVFGPADRYPYAGDLRYRPPSAPLSDYLALAKTLGIARMVFVQPSAYGRDNRCMLDAMREVGIVLCRGVVDIDDDVDDESLRAMDAIGVRAVRINVSPVKQREPGFARTMVDRIRRLDARCAALGWHLDFLGPGWLTEELLPTLAELECHHTLAHLGMFLAKDGPTQPGFERLLDLMSRGARRTWVKLTGSYRMSARADFADVTPMARAAIAAAPDRVIWGSDYPHLSFADRVGSVELFDKLLEWAPAEGDRRRILVENPEALFGF